MLDKTQTLAVLTEHEMSELRSLVERRSGILFDQSRERFFTTRVREHLQAKHLAHGAELLRLLKTSNVEYDALMERLLTRETSFFRYPDAFDGLEKKVLPELHMKKFWENPRRLRVWSAGCSTGEEPYSLAMTIADALEFAQSWDVHILATDISRSALHHAERGLYSARALETLAPRQVEAHFNKTGGHYMVKPRLRQMISFAPVNLAESVYLGRFDLIFCMNVLIYFSDEGRATAIQRFHEYLDPGGYLFLGHAESMAGVPVKFETIVHRDCRIYRKPVTGRLNAGGESRP